MRKEKTPRLVVGGCVLLPLGEGLAGAAVVDEFVRVDPGWVDGFSDLLDVLRSLVGELEVFGEEVFGLEAVDDLHFLDDDVVPVEVNAFGHREAVVVFVDFADAALVLELVLSGVEAGESIQEVLVGFELPEHLVETLELSGTTAVVDAELGVDVDHDDSNELVGA